METNKRIDAARLQPVMEMLQAGRPDHLNMQAITGRVAAGHFAVLTQGFPQLVRVNAEVLHADDSRVFGERSPVICQVRMINEYPLIPDFERIETMIEEETRAA